MRVVKEHDVRRKELLDTAERLFITKGFNQTTINDIRQAVGIAKGTFYHYFKSKDDILDAMIERIIDQDLVRARAIVEDQTISPIEKIAKILLAQRPEVGDSKESMIKVAHEPENLAMHVKTIVQSIQRLSPVITEVIIQGIDNGDFHTNNPRTVMDILLISGQMLFDEAIFDWPLEERVQRLVGFVQSAERLLGAKKGSFNFIYDILDS